MNVNLITPGISPSSGGIQCWAYYIKMYLEENNALVTIFNRNDYKSKYSALSSSVIRSSFDVYILMSWRMVLYIIVPLFKSTFTNKKFVVILHGDEIVTKNKYSIFLIKKLVERSDFYWVANSDYTAKLFFELTSKNVDLVCPPFSDYKYISDKEKKINSNDEFSLFSITRLVKRKNIISVIKAVSELVTSGRNIKYNIAGVGPEFDYINQYVTDNNLVDFITIHGKVSESYKNELYSSADLFILPSIIDDENESVEGYGIVFIEANSFGLPAISGCTGGQVESVIDGITGLHSTGDVASIKKLLIKVISGDVDFDTNAIREHVLKHDYRTQDEFFKIIYC